MTSVKVAVRVRPFNTREKEANSVSIISMDAANTYIQNPVSIHIFVLLKVTCMFVVSRTPRINHLQSLDSITVTGAMMVSLSQTIRMATCIRSQAPDTSTRTWCSQIL